MVLNSLYGLEKTTEVYKEDFLDYGFFFLCLHYIHCFPLEAPHPILAKNMDTQHDLEGLVDSGITKISGETHFIFCVDKVRDALNTCGFFQIVNHDIPIFVLDEIVHARTFYLYSSSIHATNWRDCILFKIAPKPPSQEKYQGPCRYMFLILI
uniref:Non-haem dioxygenase N-terminal domain-containing protein n=1 Tax=Solanum lycopersicum TaxID=4081 RepID=A0A3Q7EC15_SOLLC